MGGTSITLPDWVKPGVSFEEAYGNHNDRLWHVRAIVDDGAVCRCWRKSKQRWHYEWLSPVWFFVAEKNECLRPRPALSS
jgi:hypothetical protein